MIEFDANIVRTGWVMTPWTGETTRWDNGVLSLLRFDPDTSHIFFKIDFFSRLLQLRAQDVKIVCSYRFAKSGTQEGGLDFMRRQNTLLESGWHIQGAIKSSHQPLPGRFSKISRILKCWNQKVSPIHDWSKEVRIKLLNQRVENIKKLTTLPQDEIKQSNMIDWSW